MVLITTDNVYSSTTLFSRFTAAGSSIKGAIDIRHKMTCAIASEPFFSFSSRQTGVIGECKYYLSNLPAHTTLKTLAATVKARWIREKAHRQLEEELASTTSKVGDYTGAA